MYAGRKRKQDQFRMSVITAITNFEGKFLKGKGQYANLYFINRGPTVQESWFWFTAIFSSSGSVPVLCVGLGNYLLNVVEGQARNLRHIETHLQRAVGGEEIGKQVKG